MNKKKDDRVGETNYNNQGCLMKIIKYIDYRNVIVQFQDEHKFEAHTRYDHFISGVVKNPYFPFIYDVGMIGVKYPAKINQKITKEYDTWRSMLRRCFDKSFKERCPAYKDVTCCNEWLCFENFYEWLHKQENFDKWSNEKGWNVDKDILVKGNKIYSPETCSLVPDYVNNLFSKGGNDNKCGLPIGVHMHGNSFQSACCDLYDKRKHLGTYSTPEEAFLAYKQHKENLIKQVGQEEYNNKNITKKCYEAMMNYIVEITD